MKHRILLRAGKSPFLSAGPVKTLTNGYTLSNVGNLLYQHAIFRHLYREDTEIDTQQHADPSRADAINATYEAFYVPLANAFRPSFRQELVALTELLKRLRIPVVVIGVGIQSYGNPVVELKPIENEIKAFCREVLARSATIGVRGNATADYLHDLGIGAVDVIGCPSMFYFGRDLPAEAPANGPIRRIALNLTPHSPDSMKEFNRGASELLEVLLARLATFEGEVVYVAQDDVALSNAVWGSRFSGDAGPTLRNLLGRDCTLETVFPLDSHTWIEYLRTFDLAVGTRIHGTIAGLLAGIRSVIVPYDSRTRELGEYFEIPALSRDAICRATSLPELCAGLDYTKTARNHPGRLAQYVAFLDRNRVRHNFDPSTLALACGDFDHRLATIKFPEVYSAVRANDDVLNEKVGVLALQISELRKSVSAVVRLLNASAKPRS